MFDAEIGNNGGTVLSLTVVILTFDEACHIGRCIRSAQRVTDDILVVDSYSTDDTVEQARGFGARVRQHPWLNHADQLNWALHNCDIRGTWVMRLDADEYLDERLIQSLQRCLPSTSDELSGFEVNRRIRFLGKEIRHGGMAPLLVTRIWRNGRAHCEQRWMDEHMVLTSGRIDRLSGAIIDENLNSLTWWVQKHNLYSNREAADLLNYRYNLGISDQADIGLNHQARVKRWLKRRVYARLPLGVRPWLYFAYRAIGRLGVLDGSRGMLFHCLQGLWYRLLVDAKIAEVERAMCQHSCDVGQAVGLVLGIDLYAASGVKGKYEQD